jgi:endonuclease YncB( thermonuclease family)
MESLVAIVLFVALGASPPAVPAAGFRASVVGITDGDTLTILTSNRVPMKIRLAGIDAPETGQDHGSAAKQLASDLAFGKEVTVEPRSTDRSGRTVAEVVLPDGRSLNREMVRAGMAWWYRQYAPNDEELAALEAEGRAARRGLWAHPDPIPPWDWRKGRATTATAEVVGNRRSHLYHAIHCRGAAAMKPENRVSFETTAEAEANGYRKAGDCW